MLIVWYLSSVPNLVQISVIVTDIDTHILQTIIWWRHANYLPLSTFGHVVISASPWCIFKYNLMQDIFIQSKVIDIFPKFKMAPAAILDFQFMWLLVTWSYLHGLDASFHEIWCRYLYSIHSYRYFTKIKDGSRRHLGFVWVSHGTTHKASFVVRTSCTSSWSAK